MTYVYGPIASQRLGQSLGIDPIPFKTCNWNCVYCQLGRTTPLTNQRREYAPPDAILADVSAALASHPPGTLDWISFVGSGEPTLHASLGVLIRRVKALTPLPVAVITNGSLLYLPEVRAELAAADAVLPTLVAGSAALFRSITRPWPGLTYERHMAGLLAFRQEYRGQLWLEVMLIKGMNDTDAALRELAAAIRRIAPDQVQITLPTRPPSEAGVAPPDAATLLRATSILSEGAQLVHPPQGEVDLSGAADLCAAIEGVIMRHPMRASDLARAVGRWPPEQVASALRTLEATGRARVVEYAGQSFWCVASGRYAV